MRTTRMQRGYRKGHHKYDQAAKERLATLRKWEGRLRSLIRHPLYTIKATSDDMQERQDALMRNVDTIKAEIKKAFYNLHRRVWDRDLSKEEQVSLKRSLGEK